MTLSSAPITRRTVDPAVRRAFHVMTKPIGPICNLDCKYCFYLEKEKLYPVGEKWKMSDEVLETYVRQYIESQDVPTVSFAWQGGEPTLLGVDFFRKVVALQERYAGGKSIENALQTNGTLLDDEWCSFLTEHRFLVGLSVDGPGELHDKYRVDKQGAPTFNDVMRGVELLKKHATPFNTLTVVHRFNSTKPLEVYHFLKQIGSGFIQFIPLVERLPARSLVPLTVAGGTPELDLAAPPSLVAGEEEPALPVTAWSVQARAYGEFLVQIFDEWVRGDVGRVFVQIFDVALANWLGMGSTLCVFAEKCGSALAIEHGGDVFPCDHYVYPQYRLGNIMNGSLGEMVDSPQQRKFGSDKLDSLPGYCRRCEVRFACNGECPKHRFIRTPDGEPNLNYLCAAYKRFFNHVDPHMKTMAALLRNQRAPAEIMKILQQEREETRQREVSRSAQRNDPCPCGSGRKFKKCCGNTVAS